MKLTIYITISFVIILSMFTPDLTLALTCMDMLDRYIVRCDNDSCITGFRVTDVEAKGESPCNRRPVVQEEIPAWAVEFTENLLRSTNNGELPSGIYKFEFNFAMFYERPPESYPDYIVRLVPDLFCPEATQPIIEYYEKHLKEKTESSAGLDIPKINDMDFLKALAITYFCYTDENLIIKLDQDGSAETLKKVKGYWKKKEAGGNIKSDRYAKKNRPEVDNSRAKKTIGSKSDFLENYYSQGLLYNKKGQYDKALFAFNKAIELEPDYDNTLKGRAKSYKHTGQYDKAIADYSKVIEFKKDVIKKKDLEMKKLKKNALERSYAIETLNSDLSSVYRLRGNTYKSRGWYAPAMADFDQSIRLVGDKDSYPYLYQYLTSKHGNIDEGKYTHPAGGVDTDYWIDPVNQLYWGKITPEECIAKTKQKDSRKDIRLKCIVYYCIGEYYLLRKDKLNAKKYFEKCVQTLQFDIEVYDLAKFELGR